MLQSINEQTKVCLACKTEQPLSNYYDNDTNSKDGKAARCIPCRKKQIAERAAIADKTRHYRSIIRAKTKMESVEERKASAERHNNGKADYSLLPLHLLEGSVRVLEKGAEKYSAWNWAKGMPWTTPYSCAMRHLAAWYRGETLDSETNENHIDHAICNLIMLKHFAEAFPEEDDRPSAFFLGDS